MRRVAAILLLGAMVTTSVASASPAGCPTMRARALKHCCCPPSGSEGARLTCCVLANEDVRTCAAFVREQTERVQIALLPVAPAFFRPSDEAVQLDIATLELVETSTDPPSVPLRV